MQAQCTASERIQEPHNRQHTRAAACMQADTLTTEVGLHTQRHHTAIINAEGLLLHITASNHLPEVTQKNLNVPTACAAGQELGPAGYQKEAPVRCQHAQDMAGADISTSSTSSTRTHTQKGALSV